MREIMEQYALLVVDYGSVPPYSEWFSRGLRPTDGGLAKIHGIKLVTKCRNAFLIG